MSGKADVEGVISVQASLMQDKIGIAEVTP
jgi:hypothetical protein